MSRPKTKPARKKVKQAIPQFGLNIDPDEASWRSLTHSKTDMSPQRHEQALEISHWLYEHDGLAAALVDLPLEMLASAGITIEAEHKKVQELIDDFWSDGFDPFKDKFMGGISGSLLTSCLVSGELTMPFSINEANGVVEFGFIDNRNILEVKKKPGNATKFDSIILKPNLSFKEYKKEYKVFEQTGDGEYEGEAIHRGIQMPINGKRGRPLLLRYVDFLDLYGQFLFNEVERRRILQSLLYVVELAGKKGDEIRAWLNDNFPNGMAPKPGSVRAMSGEKWELLSPPQDAQDASTFAEMLKLNAFGTAGWPVFYFGSGGQVNNTVSREMMTRANWKAERFNAFVGQLLGEIIHLVIIAAKRIGRQTSRGKITPNINAKFEIKFGSPFPRDEVQAAAAFSQAASGAINLREKGIIGFRTAREIVAVSLRPLGIEKTAQEIEEEVLDEKEENDENGETKSAAGGENEMEIAPSILNERPNFGERDSQAAKMRKPRSLLRPIYENKTNDNGNGIL